MLRKFILAGLLLAGMLAGAILIAGWSLSHPVPMTIGATPVDLQAQPVEFPSENGTQVHGWWCPVERSRASVLLLPGVRANRLSMVERCRFLRAAGYSTLLIDLQATGETRGDHITFGSRESRDVIAAAAFLKAHAPGQKVAIIGSSLGGAAALLAMPPLRVDAAVLEAVYPTIEQATGNRTRRYLGPLGGVAASALLWQLPVRLGVTAEDLRPIDHIAAIGAPVLILNGSEDRNTTPADAAALFDRAAEPKELWIVEGAGHVDLHRAARVEYERRVLTFLGRL